MSSLDKTVSITKSPECITPSAFDTKSRKQSAKVGIFNLISTMIGGGALSLPFAISRCGLILGFSLLFLSAMLSIFSFDILIATSRRTGAMTYQQIGYFAFGSKLALFVTVIIWFNCYIASIAYCVLIGDLIKPVVMYIFNISNSTETLRRIVIASAILCVSPFCYMRQIGGLKYTSIISILSIVVLTTIITVKTLQHFGEEHTMYYINDDGDSTSFVVSNTIDLWPKKWEDVVYVFPVFGISFLCHFNIPQVHSELTRPTRKRMPTTTKPTSQPTASPFLAPSFAPSLTVTESTVAATTPGSSTNAPSRSISTRSTPAPTLRAGGSSTTKPTSTGDIVTISSTTKHTQGGTTEDSADSAAPSSNSSVTMEGLLIGMLLGGLVVCYVFTCIGIAVYCIWRRKINQNTRSPLNNVNNADAVELQHVHPDDSQEEEVDDIETWTNPHSGQQGHYQRVNTTELAMSHKLTPHIHAQTKSMAISPGERNYNTVALMADDDANDGDEHMYPESYRGTLPVPPIVALTPHDVDDDEHYLQNEDASSSSNLAFKNDEGTFVMDREDEDEEKVPETTVTKGGDHEEGDNENENTNDNIQPDEFIVDGDEETPFAKDSALHETIEKHQTPK